MSYLRRLHNLWVLSLVLIINLVISPAFATPVHQPVSPASNSDISVAFEQSANHGMRHDGAQHDEQHHHHPQHAQHQPTEAPSPHTASNKHTTSKHCDSCLDDALAPSEHCDGSGDRHPCKSCNNSHCQYSVLPGFQLTQSELSAQPVPQLYAVSSPISRSEDSLRPPIH